MVETLDRTTTPAVATECKVLGAPKLNLLARIGKTTLVAFASGDTYPLRRL